MQKSLLSAMTIFLALFCFQSSSAQTEALCDCKRTYSPVCGKDGRTYLNACIARCLGVKIKKSSECSESKVIPEDTLTWPIEEICEPVYRQIRSLGDGTYYFSHYNVRGVRKVPCYKKCLPPATLIATPKGEIPIEALQIGDVVWTLAEENRVLKRVATPIKYKTSQIVPEDHQMVSLTLKDGRSLEVSAGHPGPDYVAIGKLKVGDELDGSVIIEKKVFTYQGFRTMDIFPAVGDGLYWANGILLGSTIMPNGL